MKKLFFAAVCAFMSVSAMAQDVKCFIDDFTKKISETNYNCSVGYSYRGKKRTEIVNLLKDAEKKMYYNKAEFYKNSSIERRKV